MPITLADLNDRQKAMIPISERKALGIGEFKTAAEVVTENEAKLEEEIALEIMSLLMHAGITAHRANPKKKSTITPGHPDLWFSVGGLACAFEVKAAWGALSEDQEKCITQMRGEGWRVEVVTSSAQAMAHLRAWRASAS